MPLAAGVAAEGFKTARAGPLDPDARMTRADDLGQALRNAELGEQRLYPGMQRLTRAVTSGRFALAQHDAEASRRAGDGGRAARRPASDDDYVGIDRSIVHGPSSRWINTVLPDT